ncbi:MAG: hypothetical protein KC731_14820, partial [Myxococcales bacterium]|nr:hypothetical protein [Myxococcales bacterium]
LSHGLLLSREERSGTDTEVVLVGWYRGATLEHRAEGYRAEVLALSPSGRHAAAIVGSDGLWWDLAKNEARPLPRPEARGFPDGLVFDGEARLRLVHERPATTHVIDLPDGSWRAERTPSFDGFRGTALAPSGEAAGLRDDALVLAPDHELAPKGVSGFAFAGNGQRLFAGIAGSLKWFSASGELEGSIPLSCRPGALAVDRSGARVALACGDGLLIADPPGARTVRLVDLPAGERRIERVFLSSDGRRAFAQSGGSLLVVDADAGAWRGTLSLRAGRLVASTADGRLWFEGDSPWAGRDGCQVGHRVFPAAWCADRLMDDLALERWIVGGFD